MNAAHLHLLVNHLPIFGSMLSLVLFALALWRRDRGVQLSATVISALAAVGAAAALWTGEPAEEVVEGLPGVAEAAIHDHEEAAELAAVLMLGAGALSIGALLLSRRAPAPGMVALGVPAVATLAAVGALTVAGSTGGKIRHPEIADGAPVAASGWGEEHEEGEEE